MTVSLETLLQDSSFQEGKTGQRVIWDTNGWGLGYSGIERVAQRLLQEFDPQELRPLWLQQELPQGLSEARLLRRLVSINSVWPRYTAHRLRGQKWDQPTCYHAMNNFNLPRLPSSAKNLRLVQSVYDIIPLLVPEQVSRSMAVQFRLNIKGALETADSIICSSHWTHSALVERFPWIEAKLRTIPLGVEPLSPIQERRTPPLSPLQMLCVSRFESYKNFPLLIQLLAKAPTKVQLHVITNTAGLRFFGEAALDYMKKGILRIHTGIHEQKLQELYQSSHILIHPSLYEGFGLPLAEALVRRLPAVYIKGTGTDQAAGRRTAIGLHADATANTWWQAIETAIATHDNPQLFADDHNEKPCWQDVARQFQEHYSGLF